MHKNLILGAQEPNIRDGQSPSNGQQPNIRSAQQPNIRDSRHNLIMQDNQILPDNHLHIEIL